MYLSIVKPDGTTEDHPNITENVYHKPDGVYIGDELVFRGILGEDYTESKVAVD